MECSVARRNGMSTETWTCVHLNLLTLAWGGKERSKWHCAKRPNLGRRDAQMIDRARAASNLDRWKINRAHSARSVQKSREIPISVQGGGIPVTPP